jgi:hypothetical protein
VHLAPTHLHEAAIKNVEEAVWHKIMAEVPDHPKLFMQENNAGTETLADFTTKIPDMILSYAPNKTTAMKPVFVVEIGFTESYTDLLKSMRIWLSGHEHVKIAFLVKFEESPRYSGKKCLSKLPPDLLSNADKYLKDRDAVQLAWRDGKVFAHGASFVGHTKGFLEVWRRSTSGKATLRGKRIVRE